jgi:diguanylate cyclase (GGDEF)-like protein
MANLMKLATAHRRSMVVRLAVFGVCMVALGFILRIAIMLPFLTDKLIELSSEYQLSMAEYVAKDIDVMIRTRMDFLGHLAATLPADLLTDPLQLEAWLKDRHENNPIFSQGLTVVMATGAGAIADYPVVAGRRDQDFSTTDCFVEAVNGRRIAIGKPARGRTTGDPVILMAAQVTDRSGEVVAVLIGTAAMAAPGFLNLLQETRIGRTGGFLLISPKDDLFVAATNTAKVLTPLPKPGVNPLHDRAMAGYRGTGTTVNIHGVEELSAIASVPSTGWFLVAQIPTSEALRALDSVRGFLVRGTGVAAIIVLVAVSIAMRAFFKPLTSAAQQLHLMANGEIEIKPLPVGYRDEVGELAIGFNFLLGKLRDKEAALRESEARMGHLAHHDMLTGLPNRTLFEDRLTQTLARAERNGTPFALLYLDLDDFKPINDTHGHEAGDEVLRQVAQRLAGVPRKSDTVARLGGDEFAILLEGLEDASANAALIADKCRDAVVAPILFSGRSVTVGLSIGVARYPEDGRGMRELFRHADQAMYCLKKAKAGTGAGRARVPVGADLGPG